MLRHTVPLIFLLTSVNSGWLDGISRYPFMHADMQVASPSQVKFALENKYDNTGPGAKQPEYAYNAYKNLDDALVAYLNDPDTKLPEYERERAVNKLLQVDPYDYRTPANPFLKDERVKTSHTPPFQIQNTQIHKVFYWPKQPIGKHFYDQDAKVGKIADLDVNDVSKTYQGVTKVVPFKFQKIHKAIPLSLGHYTREQDFKMAHEQFDTYPKYMYSYYGVHDKPTGASKTVQEMRDGGNVHGGNVHGGNVHGGNVHGFYSHVDADGKLRTVHY